MDHHEKMIDSYWLFYQDLYYQLRYYEHYKAFSHRMNTVIVVILLASSMAGVSGLWLWKEFPQIWAVIVAVVQIVSASTFLMPYSEQIWVLGRLLPELDLLLNRVEYDWNTISEKSDAEIARLIFAYTEEQCCLEQRYIGSMYFPPSRRCRKKAIEDQKMFNASRYRVTSNAGKD